MPECGGFSEEELTRIIVLSVICALLTCCFVVWVVACCVILFKKDGGGQVIRRTREERFGSQAVNLVKPGQPLEDTRQSKMLESPAKVETFGRKTGKEVAKNLKETGTELKVPEPEYQSLTLEKSVVTFNTFGVKPKISQETYIDANPIADGNEIDITPNPNYEVSADILNDQDSLPLVQDTPIRRTSKSDLAKKFSSGSGLEVDAKKEGPKK